MKATTLFFILAALLALTMQTSHAQKFKVGLSMTNMHLDRWQKEKEIIIEKIKKAKGEVIFADAEDDVEKQVQQATEMMDAGVKVLIVVPVDCIKAARIVEMANERNVKVIAYDRLILLSYVDYYVSYSSIRIGELITEQLVRQRPKGNFVFLNGPEADFNSNLIKEGVMNILDPKIISRDIHLVMDVNLNEWSARTAKLELARFMADNPNAQIDAVICGNDEIAMGVLALIKEKGLKDISVAGQDADLEACKKIVKGEYAATIYSDVSVLASEAAKTAIKVAEGLEMGLPKQLTHNGTTAVNSLLLEPVLVTKDNLDAVIINGGYWTKEQVYGTK